MNYGILLIGFEYHNNTKWEQLPGISIDLYRVYRYFYKHFNNNQKKICLFTDIPNDHHISILQKAILEGHADSNLLSFIEDVKDRNQYVLYSSEKKNGYNFNNFDVVISDFCKKVDRLIIYYSGHGKDGDLILPDSTHVPLIYLRDIIFKNIKPISQSLIILDCCQSNGMDLGFCYDSNKIKNNKKQQNKKQEKKNKRKNKIKNIICISSTKNTQDSTATYYGSPFTLSLMNFFEKKHNNIITFRDLISIETKIIIYVSSPHLNCLWRWVNKNNPAEIDIYVDELNSVVKITLNKSQITLSESSSVKDYMRYNQKRRYYL